MNKKIRFFQSINFKIAIVFVLLVLITVELIGAYFVKQLEQQNIDSFKSRITIENYIQDQLAVDLAKKDTSSANSDIRNLLSESSIANSADIQVVDVKGAVRGDSNVTPRTPWVRRVP